MKPELIPVLERDTIQQRVEHLGERISEDYEGLDLILIGVLKGAFVFMADLVRALRIPVKMDFIQVGSYGAGTVSSGSIRLVKGLDLDVRSKHVLLVEDIVDTGLTLRYLMDHLVSLGAADVRVCTMIDKRERREASVTIDYACHEVREGFLVGYGLDHDQRYRELPGIYHLKF
jgi:hypoxanthine phosphoribosyltransferase